MTSLSHERASNTSGTNASGGANASGAASTGGGPTSIATRASRRGPPSGATMGAPQPIAAIKISWARCIDTYVVQAEPHGSRHSCMCHRPSWMCRGRLYASMPRRADRPTTYVGAPTSFIEIPDVAEQRGARVRLATAAERARVRLAIVDPAIVFALAGSARLEREDWILDAATWFVMPAKTRASL